MSGTRVQCPAKRGKGPRNFELDFPAAAPRDELGSVCVYQEGTSFRHCFCRRLLLHSDSKADLRATNKSCLGLHGERRVTSASFKTLIPSNRRPDSKADLRATKRSCLGLRGEGTVIFASIAVNWFQRENSPPSSSCRLQLTGFRGRTLLPHLRIECSSLVS